MLCRFGLQSGAVGYNGSCWVKHPLRTDICWCATEECRLLALTDRSLISPKRDSCSLEEPGLEPRPSKSTTVCTSSTQDFNISQEDFSRVNREKLTKTQTPTVKTNF